MKWKPHKYQDTALRFVLKSPEAGLAIDMGMGKTSVMLKALTVLQRNEILDSMLVIAPLRVATTVWPEEVAKWDEFQHLKVSVVHGTADQRLAALHQPADIYVTNPENTQWLFDQRWKLPKMLVVDESTKFKNGRSKRFRSLKPMLPKFTRRHILTGTPAPNGLLDLWGQSFVLDLGEALGAYVTHYRMRYFEQSGFGGYKWTLKEGAEELIYNRLRDTLLRMDARDYLNMPPIMKVRVPVTIPAPAYRKYAEMEHLFLTQLDAGEITAANAAARSVKLRQMANGQVYDEFREAHDVHNEKLGALLDLVEQLQGNPLIVVYEFKHDRDRIVEALGCPTLGGGVGVKAQQKILRAWNARELPVLALHPASAGHGLNLQAGGHHVCWYGLTWNLEHYDQTIARVWRQGQTEKVMVYHLVAQETIDETVLKVLGQKNRSQRALLDALKRRRTGKIRKPRKNPGKP